MDKTGMLENTRNLVEVARAAGATIVHAPITFAPGCGELSEHPYGILKGVVDATAFVKGAWGAEIVDSLSPRKGDVVVEGKRGLDTSPRRTSTSFFAPAQSQRSRSAGF
jgi:nicotinamidase-related amidase